MNIEQKIHTQYIGMKGLNTFLESSTIHGLTYISIKNKRFDRIFWMLVIMMGFTGAGILIYRSFESWNESPVKTTIETHPIAEITFPKVTVCPPKNTNTDLNYDLMMTKNKTLNDDIRHEMEKYALDMLYDHIYDTVITNLSKIEDKDRYYNWYHGYTEVKLPTYLSVTGYNPGLWYNLYTYASSGTISTKHFGEKFDADKVEKHIEYDITVWPPESVNNNPNVTLHFEIEKVSIKDVSTGKDNFIVSKIGGFEIEYIDADITHKNMNYTPPESDKSIALQRKVLMSDLKIQKLERMPGFRFSWYYFGMEVEPVAPYQNFTDTNAFVRNCSNIFKMNDATNAFLSDLQ